MPSACEVTTVDSGGFRRFLRESGASFASRTVSSASSPSFLLVLSQAASCSCCQFPPKNGMFSVFAQLVQPDLHIESPPGGRRGVFATAAQQEVLDCDACLVLRNLGMVDLRSVLNSSIKSQTKLQIDIENFSLYNPMPLLICSWLSWDSDAFFSPVFYLPP